MSTYDSVYNLTSTEETTIRQIVEKIKSILVSKYNVPIASILTDISIHCTLKNKYFAAYWEVFKILYKEYLPDKGLENIHPAFKYLLNKEFNLSFPVRQPYLLTVHEPSSIFFLIMRDDLPALIEYLRQSFISIEDTLDSALYPIYNLNLLEVAAYHGSLTVFKYLLEKMLMKVTQNCLYLAIIGGCKEIIDLCLQSQKMDDQCMIYALRTHNYDLVQDPVLSANVDKSKFLEYNLRNLVLYIKEKQDMDVALLYSFHYYLPPLWDYLSDNGATINAHDNEGNTPLHIAASHNYVAALQWLTNHGANIKLQNSKLQTPICIASKFQSVESCHFLLDNGANALTVDDSKVQPLHYACSYGNIRLITTFLDRGADINSLDQEGHGTLYYAIKSHSLEAFCFLIDHGADIHVKDTKGHSLIFAITSAESIPIFNKLLQLGFNINETDTALRTVLSYAAERNDQVFLDYLMHSGANVNHQDAEGKSPLHHAVQNGKVTNAKLLVLQGSMYDLEDNKGKVPIELATMLVKREVVNYLQDWFRGDYNHVANY
ncbi:spectrin binding [Trichomonas vaginalis G3]|uniref:spectrin binding n=1 Tax=Trichomonas vaginalis (strain ATCC PRA-98 / G3) TaxID=412133 RepID=UPI0021E5D153|nr:spectrin binding [Trichomonas vaginalis G3]KAI5503548.1 spectrin binding [Trichomonas vaginalis G3]